MVIQVIPSKSYDIRHYVSEERLFGEFRTITIFTTKYLC